MYGGVEALRLDRNEIAAKKTVFISLDTQVKFLINIFLSFQIHQVRPFPL